MGADGKRQLASQIELIDALRRDECYPHDTDDIAVIETHISWVVLTGPFAYKIKKAVDLGFLDFAALAKRRFYCEEELRLNARWAPQLYLDVVAITGSPASPELDGGGEAIEYAVKMRQFPQQAQLDRQLDAGLLRETDLSRLAERIAEAHGSARVIDHASDREAVGKVTAPILENFEPVHRAIDMDLLNLVQRWSVATLEELKPSLIQRRKDGFVRECHGDLHLANLVRLPEGIVAFDCVEFSADLRNIDVLSDVAFLVMDLMARARQDLAYTFLNRYLEVSGDYAGMAVFGLYFVYHSMIRAKVAAIRSAERDDARARHKDVEAVKHYLAVAVRWIRQARPSLLAMHGFSGSGKTWVSSRLLAALPAIRLRSDIERKRLLGIPETASSASRPGEGGYTAQTSGVVYSRLFEQADELLAAGFTVIIDAAFLRRADRQKLAQLAAGRHIPLLLVSTRADEDTLARRLRRRETVGADPSEADTRILAYQRETAEPLNATERNSAFIVEAERGLDSDDLNKRIRARLKGFHE